MCDEMTHEPFHDETENPRTTRGPEAWLLGAFLVFFGVAVASAMPAIAAAARTAAADAARGVSNEQLKIRVVVRAEVRSQRLVLPPTSDSAGLVPASVSVPQVLLSRAADSLRGRDAVFRHRAFNARAPPPPIA